MRRGGNGNGVRPVSSEEALFGQLAKDPIPLGGQTSQSERRVDPVHDQLEAAVGWVEVQPGPDPELEVVDQGKAAGLGQGPVNCGPGILEQCHAELCRYGLPGYL